MPKVEATISHASKERGATDTDGTCHTTPNRWVRLDYPTRLQSGHKESRLKLGIYIVTKFPNKEKITWLTNT